jgi:methylated-DNA-protein-cysteine methyltransferase-like protein
MRISASQRRPPVTAKPTLDDRRILDAVRAVPRGRVASYGEIAERAGLPRRARLVGRVLAQLPTGTRVPWHRVVNAQGRISLPPGSSAAREQRQRLLAEGVRLSGGRVAMKEFGLRRTLDELLWGRPQR